MVQTSTMLSRLQDLSAEEHELEEAQYALRTVMAKVTESSAPIGEDHSNVQISKIPGYADLTTSARHAANSKTTNDTVQHPRTILGAEAETG